MNQQDFEKHIESYMLIDQKLRSIADKYADKFEGGGYVDGIEVDYDGESSRLDDIAAIVKQLGYEATVKAVSVD